MTYLVQSSGHILLNLPLAIYQEIIREFDYMDKYDVSGLVKWYNLLNLPFAIYWEIGQEFDCIDKYDVSGSVKR